MLLPYDSDDQLIILRPSDPDSWVTAIAIDPTGDSVRRLIRALMNGQSSTGYFVCAICPVVRPTIFGNRGGCGEEFVLKRAVLLERIGVTLHARYRGRLSRSKRSFHAITVESSRYESK